jgi:hypothetical protein
MAIRNTKHFPALIRVATREQNVSSLFAIIIDAFHANTGASVLFTRHDASDQ